MFEINSEIIECLFLDQNLKNTLYRSKFKDKFYVETINEKNKKEPLKRYRKLYDVAYFYDSLQTSSNIMLS